MSWATRIRERGGQEIAPPRDPVRFAATANHVLSTLVPGAAFSGSQLSVFDRIALVGQTAKAENGIYIVQPSGPPIRAIDARDPKMLVPGMFFTVEEGANADTGWLLATDDDPLIPDVTSLPFVLVGPPGSSTGAVLNPMTADLDGGGFGIFNLRDLFITGVGAPGFVLDIGSSAGVNLIYVQINSPDNKDNGLTFAAAGVPKWTFYRSIGPPFTFNLYDEAGARDHATFVTGGVTSLFGNTGIGTPSPNRLGFGANQTVLTLEALTATKSPHFELVGTDVGINIGVGGASFVHHSGANFYEIAYISGKTDAANDAGKIEFGTVGSGFAYTVPLTMYSNGTSRFTGRIAEGRVTMTLGNGDNNDVALPSTSFAKIAGPTAAFAITGIVAGGDGDRLDIFNPLNQTMTIRNENASSTAANRISTLSGADLVLRANLPSFVTLIYDTGSSRWKVVDFN